MKVAVDKLVNIKEKLNDLPPIKGRAKVMAQIDDDILFLNKYKTSWSIEESIVKERELEYRKLAEAVKEKQEDPNEKTKGWSSSIQS